LFVFCLVFVSTDSYFIINDRRVATASRPESRNLWLRVNCVQQNSHLFELPTINNLLRLNKIENSHTRRLQFAIHCMGGVAKELNSPKACACLEQFPLHVLWSRTNKQKDNKTKLYRGTLNIFASLVTMNHELHWSSSDLLCIYYTCQTVMKHLRVSQ